MNLREVFMAADAAYDDARSKLAALLATAGLKSQGAYTWVYVDPEGILRVQGWDGTPIVNPQVLLEAGFDRGIALSGVSGKPFAYLNARGEVAEQPKP